MEGWGEETNLKETSTRRWFGDWLRQTNREETQLQEDGNEW